MNRSVSIDFELMRKEDSFSVESIEMKSPSSGLTDECSYPVWATKTKSSVVSIVSEQSRDFEESDSIQFDIDRDRFDNYDHYSPSSSVSTLQQIRSSCVSKDEKRLNEMTSKTYHIIEEMTEKERASTKRKHRNSDNYFEFGKENKKNRKSNRRFCDLPLEWWERGTDCKRAKEYHTRKLDYYCDSREDLVLQTTLWRKHTVLEPNMFPYRTPRGIKHYTLWSRSDMTHDQIIRFVDDWLKEKMPHVRRWQYDDNSGERSVLLFHVHVFIETDPYSFTPRPGQEYFPPHVEELRLRKKTPDRN